MNSKKMETNIIYDGSFEGLLTAVFDIYDQKLKPTAFQTNQDSATELFTNPHLVVTDESKHQRVAAKLRAISASFLTDLYKVFLTEDDHREHLIFRLIQKVLANSAILKGDYRDDDLRVMKQWVKKIGREVHRMHAFVRFQKLKDELWYAGIEPDFDVIPLLSRHFKKRFADQRWLIYDLARHYGIYYDLKKVDTVQFSDTTGLQLGVISKDNLHEEEKAYQTLWKDYFNSVNIAARKNLKLHIQHVPKRYWKYLPEK